MAKYQLNSTSTNRSPLTFFLLVFALSIPLSLAGAAMGLELLPGVPVSALVVTFCPLIAACILVYRENKVAGVTGLLKRAFDYKRIRSKVWYAPAVLLMPGVMILEYGLMRWMGSPLPVPQFPVWAVLAENLIRLHNHCQNLASSSLVLGSCRDRPAEATGVRFSKRQRRGTDASSSTCLDEDSTFVVRVFADGLCLASRTQKHPPLTRVCAKQQVLDLVR